MEKTGGDERRPRETVTLHFMKFHRSCSSMHPRSPSPAHSRRVAPRPLLSLSHCYSQASLQRVPGAQREGQADIMASASASAKPSEPRGCPQTRKRKRAVTGIAGTSKASQASVKSDKFVHVHHYLDSGRWGAWFNDPRVPKGFQNRRLYFGTYETEYLAARAQDRAALMFKPFFVKGITCLNFEELDYELDRDLRDALKPDQFRKLLMEESRKCYRKKAPSPCLWKFLEEERTKGNLSIDSKGRNPMQPRTIPQILKDILGKWKPVINTMPTTQAEGKWDRFGEDKGQVGNAKRTRRLTHVALEQPANWARDTLVTRKERSLRARPMCQPLNLGVPLGEGELPVESQSSQTPPVTLEPLVAWERTSQRPTCERLNLAPAAPRDVALEEEDRWNMLLLACALPDVIGGTLHRTEEDTGNELKDFDLNTRGRLDIDLNLAIEDLMTAKLVEPPNEVVAGSSEEMDAQNLVMMMKLL